MSQRYSESDFVLQRRLALEKLQIILSNIQKRIVTSKTLM